MKDFRLSNLHNFYYMDECRPLIPNSRDDDPHAPACKRLLSSAVKLRNEAVRKFRDSLDEKDKIFFDQLNPARQRILALFKGTFFHSLEERWRLLLRLMPEIKKILDKKD